jgi:uncharacterized protein YjbI with pentapeptide repeats
VMLAARALQIRGTILMKATLTALTLAVSLIASGASAFDPADLQKLKDTGNCVDCDLGVDQKTYKGVKLQNANLTGANLEGAVMNAVRLQNANLKGANLKGTSLASANLEGANLSYTIMNGAILCNTTMPNGSVIYSGC